MLSIKKKFGPYLKKKYLARDNGLKLHLTENIPNPELVLKSSDRSMKV